ncbi:ANTAR domain-containing protein [Streptomyces sp. Qhu-G9]|uniref:ANTAR domain-containing protein n=1 Tax=Streptomyces sp. Qhu-G9 TaxID=3452799 RepID=UPI0022ABFFF6|nr:ANTAR domain-containing protein [Streptomyces aurantiacus]WAU82732.1 ANTAR domain-containing protein [Streptomyces aurantiacus]
MRPSRHTGPPRGRSGAGAAANASACHGFHRSRPNDDAAPATPAEDAKDAERWRREAQQLRKAMKNRPTIDMARGILMTACSCSPDDAWEMLVTVSQHSNTKLHQVAEALVAATARQEPLPAKLQHHLAPALAARRRE